MSVEEAKSFGKALANNCYRNRYRGVGYYRVTDIDMSRVSLEIAISEILSCSKGNNYYKVRSSGEKGNYTLKVYYYY
jgi:hypothetical protein